MVKFAEQEIPKGGTADAAKTGLKYVSEKSKIVVVINGDDSAFFRPESIKEVIDLHKKTKSTLTFVSLERENPKGLGRVIRNSKGELLGIVEEKDATEAQRRIKEVNDGLYVLERDWLDTNINKVQKSPVTGEYYLVDLVQIAVADKKKVFVYKLKDSSEWQGINTPDQLSEAEQEMRERLGKYAA